jgi:hypothetical protein
VTECFSGGRMRSCGRAVIHLSLAEAAPLLGGALVGQAGRDLFLAAALDWSVPRRCAGNRRRPRRSSPRKTTGNRESPADFERRDGVRLVSLRVALEGSSVATASLRRARPAR